MAKVKIVINTPGPAAKAVEFADIKGQGRIPYGKTADAPMAGDTIKTATARGMGAAKRGGKYITY
jgi:hypothetical protein|tara:strand:+ start:440 stop:634 length:195 start_codon:yes stop_codon:yes gene_type:complete